MVGSCQGGDLSWWGVVLVGVVMVRSCPSGALSGREFTGGCCPSGGCPIVGVVLVRNCPNGELSWWVGCCLS